MLLMWFCWVQFPVEKLILRGKTTETYIIFFSDRLMQNPVRI
jgi:hypothetical protein